MNLSNANVVKGFLSAQNVDYQKSEEDSIFLSISERLPSIVVDQQTCRAIISQDPQTGRAQSIPFSPHGFLQIARISPTDDLSLLLILESANNMNKSHSQQQARVFNLKCDEDTYAFVSKDYMDSQQRESDRLHNQYSLSMNKQQLPRGYSSQKGVVPAQLIELFLANFSVDIAVTSHQLLGKLTFNNIGFSIQPLKTTSALRIQDSLVLEQLRVDRRKRKVAELSQQQQLNTTTTMTTTSQTLTTGYLTQSSNGRIAAIQTEDPNVYTTKLLGIWIECDKNVNDIYLWTLFTEFAKNAALKKANVEQEKQEAATQNRRNQQQQTSVSFLFVWFETGRDLTAPLNFLITISPDSTVKKAMQKATTSTKPQQQGLVKFDFSACKFSEVTLLENALNLTFQPQNPQQVADLLAAQTYSSSSSSSTFNSQFQSSQEQLKQQQEQIQKNFEKSARFYAQEQDQQSAAANILVQNQNQIPQVQRTSTGRNEMQFYNKGKIDSQQQNNEHLAKSKSKDEQDRKDHSKNFEKLSEQNVQNQLAASFSQQYPRNSSIQNTTQNLNPNNKNNFKQGNNSSAGNNQKVGDSSSDYPRKANQDENDEKSSNYFNRSQRMTQQQQLIQQQQQQQQQLLNKQQQRKALTEMRVQTEPQNQNHTESEDDFGDESAITGENNANRKIQSSKRFEQIASARYHSNGRAPNSIGGHQTPVMEVVTNNIPKEQQSAISNRFNQQRLIPTQSNITPKQYNCYNQYLVSSKDEPLIGNIKTIEEGKLSQNKTLQDQQSKINQLENQLLHLKDQLKMSKNSAGAAVGSSFQFSQQPTSSSSNRERTRTYDSAQMFMDKSARTPATPSMKTTLGSTERQLNQSRAGGNTISPRISAAISTNPTKSPRTTNSSQNYTITAAATTINNPFSQKANMVSTTPRNLSQSSNSQDPNHSKRAISPSFSKNEISSTTQETSTNRSISSNKYSTTTNPAYLGLSVNTSSPLNRSTNISSDTPSAATTTMPLSSSLRSQYPALVNNSGSSSSSTVNLNISSSPNTAPSFFSIPKHARVMSLSSRDSKLSTGRIPLVAQTPSTPQVSTVSASIKDLQVGLQSVHENSATASMSSRVKPPMNPCGSVSTTRKYGISSNTGETTSSSGGLQGSAGGYSSSSSTHRKALSKVSSNQSVTTAASSAEQHSQTRRSRSIQKTIADTADMPRIRFDFSNMISTSKEADHYDESNYLVCPF